MPLFGRRRAGTATSANEATAATNGHHHHEKHQNRNAMYDESFYSRRPTFGQWIKITWPDILTMVCMGLLGLGIYEAHPAANRSFPITFSDGEIVYPEFAYPLRKEIVPIWAAALLAVLVPILFILIAQIRVRSFWDVNNGVVGLLYSVITAAVFQVWLKWLIGGLRPHFLAVCKPNVTAPGSGFGSIMYDMSVCTGDRNEIDDSLESFPSGHTTAAFGGFVYLYLYLNAKLKVWSNYHPAYWKLIVTYMPILGATLIGGALTIDEFHNWYDILAGAVIGTIMAFSAYRMVYASVWDFRFNHIPLTRHYPFTFGAGGPGSGLFGDAVWTRQAGWGHDAGMYGGAPFDAASGGGGAGAAAGGMASGMMSSGHGHGNGNGHGLRNEHEHGHSHGLGHHHTNSGGGSANSRAGIPRRPVGGHAHGDNIV